MKRIAACLILTVFLGGAAVFGDDLSGEKDEKEGLLNRKNRYVQDFAEELELTSVQKEDLEARRKQNEEAMRAFRAEMRQARSRLYEQLKKPEHDPLSLQLAVDEVKKLQAVAIDRRVEQFLELKGILTREQFSRMLEMREESRTKRDRQERREGWQFWRR